MIDLTSDTVIEIDGRKFRYNGKSQSRKAGKVISERYIFMRIGYEDDFAKGIKINIPFKKTFSEKQLLKILNK